MKKSYWNESKPYCKYIVEKDGKTGEIHAFGGLVRATTIDLSWALGKQWDDIKCELRELSA